MNAAATLVQNFESLVRWVEAHTNELLFARQAQPIPVAVYARKIGTALLPALAVVTLCSADASAQRYWDHDSWADGKLVDVQIRVDGQPAPLYWAPERGDRQYFEAFAGRNYSLVLRNNTGRRVGVLLAVDGLNVVNGEMTRLASDEPMYVLGAYEQATIRGWRTSLSQIRRFVFVDERRSYAERTGQANSDMGWVRVLTFNERRPMWDPNVWMNKDQERRTWGQSKSLYRDGGGGSAPQATPPPSSDAPQVKRSLPETDDLRAGARDDAAPQRAQGEARSMSPQEEGRMTYEQRPETGGSFPGTGWGDRSTDVVRQVQFSPERSATDRILFRYEYASGLQALGIHRDRYRLYERDGDMGFAQPPRR